MLTAVKPQAVQAQPFLKWAGSKRQLLPKLRELYPHPIDAGMGVRSYHEPFLGGGAVFFDVWSSGVASTGLFLSDLNAELITTYKVVQTDLFDLIGTLNEFARDHSPEFYLQIRAQNPKLLGMLERAARFIYLNKTCFNGLYRVNAKGQFNVPMGKYANPRICDGEGLHAAARALQGAVLTCESYDAAVLKQADRCDFVYFDPPYVPLKPGAFTKYTADDFGESEHRHLAEVYRELSDRGCYVMLSNSDTPWVRELYRGFNVHTVQARRAINSKGSERGPVGEVVVTNYNPKAPLV